MSAPNTTPPFTTEEALRIWAESRELDRRAELRRAAAPELYEALQSAPIIGPTESAAAFRERQDQWLRVVCNPAIRKARGEA